MHTKLLDCCINGVIGKTSSFRGCITAVMLTPPLFTRSIRLRGATSTAVIAKQNLSAVLLTSFYDIHTVLLDCCIKR